MTDWQPIDTAPKDGTHVLLFCTYTRHPPEQVTAYWHRHDWELIQVGSRAEDSDVTGQPTHWMPLPPAPSGEAEPVKITPIDLVLREANHNAFLASILAKVSNK